MRLSDRDLWHLLYACGELARRHGAWPALRDLMTRLEIEKRQLRASQSGHDFGCGGEQSDLWMSAREAAVELQLSKRQVTRLAGDLDGEIIDGRWIFRRSAVTAYAKGRRDAGTAA